MITDPDARDWDPDWCISPGEILRDVMGERDITEQQVATALELPLHETGMFLNGLRTLTAADADKLRGLTGVPAQMWLALEVNWQRYKYRNLRQGLLTAIGLDSSAMWVSDWTIVMAVSALKAGKTVTGPEDAPAT